MRLHGSERFSLPYEAQKIGLKNHFSSFEHLLSFLDQFLTKQKVGNDLHFRGRLTTRALTHAHAKANMSRQNKVGRILKEVRLNASMNRLSAFARKNDLPRYVFRCQVSIFVFKARFCETRIARGAILFFS